MSGEQTKKQLSMASAKQYAMLLLVKACVEQFIIELNDGNRPCDKITDDIDTENFNAVNVFMSYRDHFCKALAGSYRHVGASCMDHNSAPGGTFFVPQDPILTMEFYVMQAGYGNESAYYRLSVKYDKRGYSGAVTIESQRGLHSYEFSSVQLRDGYPDERGELKIAVTRFGDDDSGALERIGEKALISYVDDYIASDAYAFFPTYVRTIFDRFKSLVKKS